MNGTDTRLGLVYSVTAYSLWGFMPLYWSLLVSVPAIEVTAHRILWCALFLGGLVVLRGRLPAILAIVRQPRLVATLALTAMLISVSWVTNVWAVGAERLIQASLGYYIAPLISVAIGVFILGEKISTVRRIAVALACVAVLTQATVLRQFPFVALALGLSFAFYGYFRKTMNVRPLDGVFVEASVLVPIVGSLILFWGAMGMGAFGTRDVTIDLRLILCGPMTAVPLLFFSAGARRVRLSTLGFLHYVAPSITLLVATLIFSEPFTLIHAVTFGCVWAALFLLVLEGALEWFRNARAAQKKFAPLPPVSKPPE